MKKYKEEFLVCLKGYAMGAANVIPGVSGGTIALICGIFDRIINSLNALMSMKNWKAALSGRDGFRSFWKAVDGTFLLCLAFGVLLSIFTMAKLMEHCLAMYPIQTWAFFFGLILASAAVMLRGIQDWKVKDAIITAIGIALGVTVCTLSPTSTPDSFLFVFICGALAICTMILPGISGSFILVILGKYDYIMEAISSLDVPVLLVFGAGCLLGLLAFAKFLHWLLARKERETMLVLVGFVMGSLIKVWPWNNTPGSLPAEGLHIPGAVLWCLAGILLVAAIELAGRRSKSKEA